MKQKSRKRPRCKGSGAAVSPIWSRYPCPVCHRVTAVSVEGRLRGHVSASLQDAKP